MRIQGKFKSAQDAVRYLALRGWKPYRRSPFGEVVLRFYVAGQECAGMGERRVERLGRYWRIDRRAQSEIVACV